MLTNNKEILELKQKSYDTFKQWVGKELGSSFQKAMEENNIEDLTKLLPKISQFIFEIDTHLNYHVIPVLIRNKPEEIIKVIFEHPNMLSHKLTLATALINERNMKSSTFDLIAKYTKGLDHFKECNYVLNEKSIIEIAKLGYSNSFPLFTAIFSNSEQMPPFSEALINCIQSQEITKVKTLLSVLRILSDYDIDNINKYLYERMKTGNVEIVETLLTYVNLDQEAFNIAMDQGVEQLKILYATEINYTTIMNFLRITLPAKHKL